MINRMNPNNQTQPTPEQPINPAIVVSPQVVTAPQEQFQSVAAAGQPTTPSNPQVLSEKATTYIKRVKVTAIILGVSLVIIGVLLGLFINIIDFVYVPFGIIHLVCASKLRKPLISAKQIVLACQIIDVAVFTQFVLSFYLGAGGGGILLWILVIFTSQLTREMYKTGQITSRNLFTAKAKV